MELETTSRAPLRVLHLRNADLLGGPERLILGECTHAAPEVRPCLASFVTREQPNPFLDEAERRGLETHGIAQRRSFDRHLTARVTDLLRTWKPDVVVGHDYKANHLLRRATRRRPTPRVAIVHGYTAENLKIRIFERIDRRHLHEARAVVAVSDAMRPALRAAGVGADRLHVVPNAIDVEAVARAAAEGREVLRTAWRIDASQRLVLALGRLSPEKGGATLLDAFARLPADLATDARLVLVGDGASRTALETRAARPDLAGRVLFVGWRDDPWACLGAADVFVLPSHREGMPLALLEALAAGRAIVASAVGSVPQVLQDGRLGVLVEAGQPDALVAALSGVLQGTAALPGANNLTSHAREHYATGPRTRRLETIYARVARKDTPA